MSPSLRQPPDSPDQDPRLSDLLEACLSAERAAGGSSAELVRAAPEELRDELGQLIAVARALQSARWPVAPPRLRARARALLQARPPAAARRPSGPLLGPRRVAPWLLQAAAGLVGLALAGYGSVLGSTGALPGEPLYGVKQANEFVMLELTRDDTTRALVLLRQAGIRLDEAARLEGAGQVRAAGEVLQQYVATLGRATASLARASRSADQQARGEFEAQLEQQVGRLESLARDAAPPLRPSIQEAQAAANQALSRSQDTSGSTPGPGPSPSPTGPAATAAAVPSVSPSSAASPSIGAPALPAASPSAVASPVDQSTPVEAVRSFYRLVQHEPRDEAARLWSPRLRAAFPPAENITARFSHTREVVVERVEPVVLDETAGRATVAVVLREELDAPPGERRYRGTWDLVRANYGWLLDQPDLRPD